ncbi:cyclohydrolase [Russula ochroleuca]|uniref:Cyclohydrolase n=1 Tax=Russula ochroleuca TaxID=152965 RepID=A0A9P5JWQ6_9AGAM|nr:cyclohydrolase [Russula ochroleuca]
MSSLDSAVLTQILNQLASLQLSQQVLQAKLDSLTNPVSPGLRPVGSNEPPSPTHASLSTLDGVSSFPPSAPAQSTATLLGEKGVDGISSEKERERVLYPGRVTLTTYPDQHGVKPVPLKWGAGSATERGPVIPSRLPSSIKQRNAIGAHSGSYSIYRALAVAMGTLVPTHKPDYARTEPPVAIPPNPAWFDASKIVSFDPWGHLTPQVFRAESASGLDIRPSIAVTKAHIKLSEIDESSRKGDIVVDGKVVLKSAPLLNADGTTSTADPGVEINVSKAAVEPVWYLPGVAERFKISESFVRRALFEETGGMYPELVTRPDIKVFLPPIGGMTVYIFGPASYLSDEGKELTLRVHDECNGSDVFGSDICTCKPYLVFAIEECIRTAQRGGVGVVVYFRKEGRALGEVTKYLVYNLRKRDGDSADKYFRATELIAGVKDMRFQALMPDVLHWLGVKKIDNMVSMSDMKYDAIVQSGIRILKRYDLPEHLIPIDSRVEIDAKIAAGYFTSGKGITTDDLVRTVGRTWEETEH